MENQVKNPTWKLIGAYILCIALLIFIVLLSSCGTRRTETSILSGSEASKEQSSTSGQVKKESGSQESKSDQETTNSTDEYWKKIVNEYFNPDGTLKSRTTSMEKSRSTVNKVKLTSYNRTTWNRIDSTFTRTIDVYRYHDVYSKDKKTEASNSGWMWVVGVVLIVAVLCYFVYRYFTKPKI